MRLVGLLAASVVCGGLGVLLYTFVAWIVSAFFAGAKAQYECDDGKDAGYVDPANYGGRPRW